MKTNSITILSKSYFKNTQTTNNWEFPLSLSIFNKAVIKLKALL